MVLCTLKTALSINGNVPRREFWGWINIIFNKVDEQRRKQFGPDRTCAEWLLRNGASVKWTTTTEFLSDYNSLPIEGTRMHIHEVDATDSSIMHYGFGHFAGCNHIHKIVLHKCQYLEDPALQMLSPLNKCLKYLQVSSCNNITDEGLLKLSNVPGLDQLVLFDLPFVSNKTKTTEELQKNLPNCKVEFR